MKVLKALLIVSIFSIGNNLSAQSNDELIKQFNEIDADKNEVVTILEMERYYEGELNKGGGFTNSKKLFYGLDANSNRIITLKEYLNGVNLELAYKHSDKWQLQPSDEDRLVQKNLKKVNLRKRFVEFDRDNNKELVLTEVVDYFKEVKNKPIDNRINPKWKFYAYDANDDGKITIEEFELEPNWQKGLQRLKVSER